MQTPISSQPGSPADGLDGLLDRLFGREPTAEAEAAALAEAIGVRLLSARSPIRLEQELRELGRQGRGDVGSVLRTLIAGLPGCRALRADPRETQALLAMSRLVLLCPEPRQRAERFAALVHEAIAEFNRSGIARAGRVFELADRLLVSAPLDPCLLEPLRADAHRRLDLERLRRLVASHERLPAGMVRLFLVFAPEGLVDRFAGEARRERRELLARLIEAHGPNARAIARERLLLAQPGQQPAAFVANLVQLLRRLPTPDTRSLEDEVRAVVRLLAPGGAPAVVAEALGYLGRSSHPWAERALVLFLRELESLLLESVVCGERGDRLLGALDRTAAALARQGSNACWAALIEHGLRSEPALGDTAARLCALGAHDLAEAPELALWMIGTVNAALPPGLLTPLPASQAPRVLRILAALRGTRMPEVRELLQFLAARFPLQPVGAAAARALAAFDARPAATASGASLSGDLRLFGLPALLQNLADGRVTGVLTLGDTARPDATFVFDNGRLRSVRVGPRVGAPAVYQLLQRPFSGRFHFLRREEVVTWGGEPPRALELSELILEGLRRFDELPGLASRVPDDAAFEATGRPPSVVNEWDIDVVTRLWERASQGASPLVCEEALGVDAWQVRRCLAHWLEDSSLLPRPGSAAALCAA